MEIQMRDRGRYMDGETPRNVMLSVYPSGGEEKVSGFGMVREPGLASWKYFTYPLSALRGIKTQRNHAIWLCLDFLDEGRTETVCLPGLSNVSEVERILRQYLSEKEGASAAGEAPSAPAAAGPERHRKDSDPTGTASYFVTEAVKEAIGLYRYPAYALHRDGESVAALYRDSGGSLCFLGADGTYKKEDRRVIEARHIHYFGPAGQAEGSKEAAARIPVDLSWIPHPEAYFLYWEEMGRRAAAGEKLSGILLHYFDPKESRCGDLLLPEGVLSFLREHYPEKDYGRQSAAKRETIEGKKAAASADEAAAENKNPGTGPIEQAGSGKEEVKAAVSKAVETSVSRAGSAQGAKADSGAKTASQVGSGGVFGTDSRQRADAVSEKGAGQGFRTSNADSRQTPSALSGAGKSSLTAGEVSGRGLGAWSKDSARTMNFAGMGKEASKPSAAPAARTAAPVYEKPSYAKASEAFEKEFPGWEPVSREKGGFVSAGAVEGQPDSAPFEEAGPVPERPTVSVQKASHETNEASGTLKSAGPRQGIAAEERKSPLGAEIGQQDASAAADGPAFGDAVGSGGGCPLAHGLHDPNPGGKLTVSQYWDLAKELKKLWDDGFIDEAEYRRVKRGLLDRT